MCLDSLNFEDGCEITVSEERPPQIYRGFDRSRLAPGMCDIGVFDSNHELSHGREILRSGQMYESKENIKRIIDQVNGNPQAEFSIINSLPGVTSDKMKILRQHADQRYQRAVETGREGVDDLKIDLSKSELISLIGIDPVSQLETAFADRCDEILIRRCQAHGKFINFHTDVSLRTMQVAMNDDDEYKGGRLVFLSQDSLHAPKRPVGTVSIHENDIVHGVSMFEAGTRYGLFFFKKATKV